MDRSYPLCLNPRTDRPTDICSDAEKPARWRVLLSILCLRPQVEACGPRIPVARASYSILSFENVKHESHIEGG